MALIVTLSTDNDGRLSPFLDGEALAPATLLADLPRLTAQPEAGRAVRLAPLQLDPAAVGKPLYQALGGDRLRQALEADDDGALLLAADEAAAAIPWEFTPLPDGGYLATDYGLLRLIPDARPAPPAQPGALQVVALGADPLVDGNGQVRDGYRLRLDDELRAMRQVLEQSGVAVQARRVPPTRETLQGALTQGPAILHLSAHGQVISTHNGPQAVLVLEDRDGKAAPLLGRDLRSLPPRGVLRLVVLSACRTDGVGGDAGLARALVQNGIPAAIGMQAEFPDPLSDELAVALYRFLLAGNDLAEALRQARWSLLPHLHAFGLPVGYVSPGGWGALPLQSGAPLARALAQMGQVRWPPGMSAQVDLLGRNADLHGLARRFDGDQRVVTVVGTGGIGKTALASAFVQRFGWRWPGGVVGVSFASAPVDRERVVRELLGGQAATVDAPLEQLEAALLESVAGRAQLFLLDNYESVLQGCEAHDEAAMQVQRLAEQLAEAGASLLLTSRQQPAGLRGEAVYPSIRQPLPGLEVAPGAELFLQHSTRARSERLAGAALARDVARTVDGHAQAIILLAGEYDASSEVQAGQFLSQWPQELAAAERAGLPEHQRTLWVVFERSYSALKETLQRRLRQLSLFEMPFLAEGAALLWGLETDETGMAAARASLGRLVQRNLLELQGPFEEDGAPAAYRFQPVVRQEAARRVTPADQEEAAAGYAAYGAWLARRAYVRVGSDPALAQLVRVSYAPMEAALAAPDGVDRLWHVRRLAYLWRHFGDTVAALALLEEALPADRPAASALADEAAARVDSSLRFELANLLVTSGDLDRALKLYEQSLSIDGQIGDIQGKAASLHMMAQVFMTRGDLDRALALYQESLTLLDQIGDIKGKGVSLSMLANLQMARSQWDDAEHYVVEALRVGQQLGNPSEIAFNTVKLGQVAQGRGDLAAALSNYRKGLDIFEQLGMPEANQVRQMIAALEGGGRQGDPLGQLLGQARSAANRGDFDGAIAGQEQAVTLLRTADGEREALVTLSVALYNLAGYLGQASRHDEAVAALEEVVSLDERTGHPDLEADRRILQQARLARDLAAGGAPPEGPGLEVAAQQMLEALPPELRQQLEALARELVQMSPQEQEALAVAARRQQIQQVADLTRDAAIAARRQGDPASADLARQLEEAADYYAEGEEPGSPFDELAGYLRAVLALLHGQPPPPISNTFAGHLAAIQSA